MKSATLQHLRFPYSFLLLPIFLFTLAHVPVINVAEAVSLFFILHVFIYPASNGYNGYQDQDTSSIGGIENPMVAGKQLFWVSLVMDVIGVSWAFSLYIITGFCVLLYVCFSRLYSYRGIRLKKYPFIGYLTVILNQGALIFFVTWYTVSAPSQQLSFSPWLLVVATLLIGAFYPITQIYQHHQDNADGVRTISMVLGVLGSFLFTAILYTLALTILSVQYLALGHWVQLLILLICFSPVLLVFLKWWWACRQDISKANFRHTMRMSLLAAGASNLAFGILLIKNQLG